MRNDLAYSDLPSIWFCVVPSVMNAKHDGEGACWEQFLVVVVVSVVVETVRCCEGKSVPDLKKTIERARDYLKWCLVAMFLGLMLCLRLPILRCTES